MKLRTAIADTTALAGVALLLAGLYLVWLPLPFIAGGVGAITLGIMLDRGKT